MAISSVLQNTFKEELLGGYHSFNASGDTPAGVSPDAPKLCPPLINSALKEFVNTDAIPIIFS